MNKKEYLRSYFYVVTAILYLIALITDWEIYLSDKAHKHGLTGHRSFGGRMKFLTFINMNIQVIYFSIYAINIIRRFFEKPEINGINRFCNGLYTSIVFPAGTIVTILFWGIYHYHQDLMYPQVYRLFIPNYQNHLVHTLPLISSVADSYFTKHEYHESFFKGVYRTVVFFSSYLIWLFVIAFYGGFWVYPVLRVLSPFYRGIFFLFCALLSGLLYKTGKMVNSYFWPENRIKLK